MKHVFIINSHTTFLTSLGTINYLKIVKQKVILLCIRHYTNRIVEVPYKTYDISELFSYSQDATISLKDRCATIDTLIDEKIGEKYHLYVPHLWAELFKLLYTSKKCVNVAYVQEAGPAMRNVYETNVSLKERLKLFVSLLRGNRLFEGKWYRSGSLYKQFQLNSYAINSKFFKYLPSTNHLVKWPKLNPPYILDPQVPIFIFDGFVGNNLASSQEYMDACKMMIEVNAKKKQLYKIPSRSNLRRKRMYC